MYSDGYIVYGYTIIDICLWMFDYIYMLTMCSYFDVRWTEPIQDNLDVIDMWLWIYIYGILSRNGNQNSKYSRILLKSTFPRQSWIHNLNLQACYIEIEVIVKIFQIIPDCSLIWLKGTFSQQSWIQNMNRYI